MPDYRLTDAAQTDIIKILAESESRFGEAARRRYERLIATALMDIAASPLRPGGVARPELGEGVRTWHLRLSRERARGLEGVVGHPRHFIVYRPSSAALIVIGRVLHEAMETGRHVANIDSWD